MHIKKTTGEKIFDFINYLILILFSFLCIYPLYYCLVASFSEPALVDAHRGLLLKPLGFSLKSYQLVAQNPYIINGVLYSIFLVVVGTTVNIIFTSFGAYALSRKQVYWKRFIMILILITMYFSGGLIPTYVVITQYLHLQNTPWAIILPHTVNSIYMIIMRTYFAGIPDSMEESAKMDGANDFTILLRIIMPISLPIIAVMIVYYGVSHWNGWFYAMIFLQKSRVWRPLQLILRDVLITNQTQDMMAFEDAIAAEQTKRLVKYALIIITTMPIICIYPFMQKHFVGGIMIGSLKE